MDALRRAHLLSVGIDGASFLFSYGPRNPVLERLVDRFVQAYEEDRIEVMTLMSSNAVERVRNSVLKTIANAFRLGGKKDR